MSERVVFEKLCLNNSLFIRTHVEAILSGLLGAGNRFICLVDNFSKIEAVWVERFVNLIVMHANLVGPLGQGMAVFTSKDTLETWSRRASVLSIDWVVGQMALSKNIGDPEYNILSGIELSEHTNARKIKLVSLLGPPSILNVVEDMEIILNSDRPIISFRDMSVYDRPNKIIADIDSLKKVFAYLDEVGYHVLDCFLEPVSDKDPASWHRMARAFFAIHNTDRRLDFLRSGDRINEFMEAIWLEVDTRNFLREAFLQESYEPSGKAKANFPEVFFVTFPRSGHNALVDTLSNFFPLTANFCNFHMCTGNSNGAPVCSKNGLPVGTNGFCPSGHGFQRTHDFDLRILVDPSRRYVVQYRHPLEAICSWFDLELKTGNSIADTESSFLGFLADKISYWDGFMKKWLDARDSFGNVFLLEYEKFLANPAVLMELLTFLGYGDDVSYTSIKRYHRTISRRKHIQDHRYFNAELFRKYENDRADILEKTNIEQIITD